MRFPEAKAVVDLCSFPEYRWNVEYEGDALYVSACYDEADTITGQVSEQRTRDWVLDLSKVTRSEIVATCFKCIITSHEHRVREWFTYQNKPIYQPHHDVDALAAITEAR